MRDNAFLRQRSARLGALSAVVTALLCGVLALPVFAFASRASGTVVVRRMASGSATARCPSGEHVGFGGVVAGFAPPPNVPHNPEVFTEGMVRTAPDRWTVSGHSGTSGIGSRLTAVAYCERGAVPRVVAVTEAFHAHESLAVAATCPPGTVVVGGGFKSGATAEHIDLLVRLDRPSPSTWRAWMRNISANATTLTALAYCGTGAAPTPYTVTRPIGKVSYGAVGAVCPAGKSLLFGGLVASSPGSGRHGADLEPFTWTAPSTRSWSVSAYNAGDGAGSLQAIAYCR